DLGDATGRGIDQLEGRDLAVSQPRHGLDRGHPPEFIAHRISYSGASTHLSCRSRRLILSLRTVAIAGSPSSAHSDPITRTRGAPEGHARPDRRRAEPPGQPVSGKLLRLCRWNGPLRYGERDARQ